MKTKAIQAYKILNNMISDLVIGTSSLDHLNYLLNLMPKNESYKVGITRLCVFHIIVTLNKYIEFYNRYNDIIPKEVKKECKKLMITLKRRKIPDFRNKVVGHIWDKNTGRPITDEDHDHYLQIIYENGFKSFMIWVNNPDKNVFPETIVSIIEHTRNIIAMKYEFIDDDVFKR